MYPTLITAAEIEPVTLAQAKAQCNLEADFTDDDALLQRLIKAARQHGELLTGAAWVESTWEQPLDAFPGITAANPYAQIDLLKHPMQSIESVKYLDADGVEQTLTPVTDYKAVVQGGLSLAFVCPAYGKSWPSTRNEPQAVKVRFLAGWPATGDPATAATPEDLKSWLLIRVGDLYQHRESFVLGGRNIVSEIPRDRIDGLLARYTVKRTV